MSRSLSLRRAGWHPEVYGRLHELLDAHGDDRRRPGPSSPVAVFDFDNTCIINDIGELFSHYLIDEMRYRYDLEGFWELIHPEDGREELKALTLPLVEMSPGERENHPNFGRYLADMGALYGRRLSRAGKADCYEWAVRLHVGMTPDEVRQLARAAIGRELGRDLEEERRQSSCGRITAIPRGVRVVQEMHDLIAALDAHGIEVWIVSASNRWAVEVFAGLFGVPSTRVIGNSLIEAPDGRLTSETRRPVLFRQGKVDAIARYIRRRPIAAFGDAETDLEMLQWASDLSVVIDRGCELLRSEADRLSWALQPQSALHSMDVTSPFESP